MQLTVRFFLSFFLFTLFSCQRGLQSQGGGVRTSCFMCVWEPVQAQGRNRIVVGLEPKPSDPHALTQHKSSADHPDRDEM